MKKLIYRVSILTVILFFSFITYFTLIGFETKRFNNQINDKLKDINKELVLELNVVKLILNPFKFEINAKTLGPELIYKKKKLNFESIQTKISVKSLFENEFSLSKLNISTKSLEIKNLISFSKSLSRSAELFVLEKILKKGFLIADISLEFDEAGNLKDNYKIKGFLKDVKMNILKEYKVKDLNFIFSYENEKLELQDLKFLINNLNFYSKNLNVKKIKNDFIFQGEIENEDLILNKEKIDLFLKPYLNLSNLEIKKLKFSSQNNFSFKLKQIFKIDQLEIKSKIKLKELQVSNNPELKKIFPNIKKEFEFFDQTIDIEYKKNILNIKGGGNILFQNKKDIIDYTITKKEQNYNFISTIKIVNNPLNIELLNYKKDLNNDAAIIFQGGKNVNNRTKFDLISYIEKDNKIEIKNLFFDKNFKIIDLKSAHFDFLDKKNNLNKFSITKKKDNYYLNGPILNADKLIENLIDEDNSSKITERNFKILINIDNLIIDKDYDLKNFKGDLMIKNQEIINGNLTGYFSNNKKLNFTVQSKDNQKITTLYLDEANAIVSRYKFIKGFKGGLLDFYSTKQNGQSVSKLKIYDFRLKELPALTKLLTLASLQGIADLVSGEGIGFDEFEMSFKNENNIMTINEIYAIGPAISILMDGYIEKNKLVSLRGTLVPATTINKIISAIPVLGKILVGSKTGEGVFGVSFKIKGPPKDLETTVNPIKTLTPRFITRTLEKIKKN